MSLKRYPSNDYKIDAKKEILKNAEDLLETRNKIINAFRDGIFPFVKNVQKEWSKKVNLYWINRPINELDDVIKKIRSESGLNVIINKKKISLNNTEDFLKEILTGKIDNRNDAKKEYLKKIQDNVDLLKSKIYRRGGKTWKLIDIFDDAKCCFFLEGALQKMKKKINNQKL